MFCMLYLMLLTANREIILRIESGGSDLLALKWPGPPRNILMMKKKGAPEVTQSVVEFAK